MSKYNSNPVGQLYEMFMNHSSSPKFVLVEESGPGHSLTFGYQVSLLCLFSYSFIIYVFFCRLLLTG